MQTCVFISMQYVGRLEKKAGFFHDVVKMKGRVYDIKWLAGTSQRPDQTKALAYRSLPPRRKNGGGGVRGRRGWMLGQRAQCQYGALG
jgi:hypothetical protein